MDLTPTAYLYPYYERAIVGTFDKDFRLVAGTYSKVKGVGCVGDVPMIEEFEVAEEFKETMFKFDPPTNERISTVSVKIYFVAI